MAHAIQIENLSFSYREVPILRDISLTVNSGECIGLIGPNGGGKTTLFKLLMGFLKPDAGSLTLFGKAPTEARHNIGYVPQNLRYDPHFPISVLELVLMGLVGKLPWHGQYSAADKESARAVIDRVSLTEHAHKAIGSLSGGQLQRALIARALVTAPKLLLLDEPTASVDPKAEVEIYEILAGLKKTMTILMVTHHLKVVMHLLDRVVCVQTDISSLNPAQVCEHLAIGLYHGPLQTTAFQSKGKLL